MNELHKRIDGLRTKVEKLINLHEKQAAENRDLRASLNRLSESKSQLEGKVKELEEKQKLQRISQAISSGGDQNTRELKLKINEYIREIDKCLTVMNK